jgi:ribonuclease HI
VAETQHIDGEFISNVFLREKKEPNKYRMILNMTSLNEFVTYRKFKMDTFETALNLITPGCYMASLDYTDAYYSLAVHLQDRKFLRFQSEGKLYEYSALPNGLSSACRFFTKVGKIPLSILRRYYGIICSGYLDDSIYVNTSGQKLLWDINTAAELVQDLGFMLNVEKSVIQPTQKLEYLGFLIDSRDMTVTLPPEKTAKLMQMVQALLRKTRATIRQVAQVVGALIAARQATKHALLFTKEMENQKMLALIFNKGHFDKKMDVTLDMKDELHWWLENLTTLASPIILPPYDMIVRTDASLQGWGVYVPDTGLRFGGRWNEDELGKHINELELIAIYHALKACCRDVYNSHIKIMTDNTTAVSAIKKQGSTKSESCNTIGRKIWFWAVTQNNWLTPAHIPGIENVEADEESRKFRDDREWTLRQDIFQEICREFGTPTIDLFATRLNCKVPRFNSWLPDPDAETIDSFTTPWSGEYFYAFPPFCLLGRVVQKIIQERTEGILVFPNWPTKSWYTVIQKMFVMKPMHIKVTNDVLSLCSSNSHRNQCSTHPLAGTLTLIACKLHGSVYG